jgi:large subunit ribosomal protein L24
MTIVGKDKGKTGLVRKVLVKQNKIIVEGLNKYKKSLRPNPMAGIQGGHVEIEVPIHISNVMLYDTKNNTPTRIRRSEISLADGTKRKVRVSKKSGEQIDE